MRNSECGMRNTWTARALVTIAMALSAASVAAAERTWTRSELLTIADKEATHLGYDVEHMSVSFDKYSSQWRNHLKSSEKEKEREEDLKDLEHRECWVIYYAPLEELTLGGNLFIFIDRETGEVIKTIGGE